MSLDFRQCSALGALLLWCGGWTLTLSASELGARLEELPMSIQVADQTVRARLTVWGEPGPRVIVPGVVLNKPGVTVHVQLVTDSAGAGAADLEFDHLWLYSGRATWEGRISGRRTTADRMLGSLSIPNGPPWPAGRQVEGLIRLIDGNGTTHLLRTEPTIVQIAED